MRYLCLACDFDGTLAHEGITSASTLKALKRVSASGRRLVLVTGRELPDLLRVFPEARLFHRIVAENGALLCRPASGEEVELGEAPPAAFVEELRRRGVKPLSVGRSIVATRRPFGPVVLEVIQELGLELHVIFNKGAVMVLPSGVNKGTGLAAALRELRLSPHNVVAAGDAENDHAMLRMCECGVAVANALPTLKERADFVTAGSEGAGVEEIIHMLVPGDLEALEPHLKRHQILLGSDERGEPFRLEPYGSRLMVAGPSGSGKSSAVATIIERLIENKYQVCLIDPKGAYDSASVVTLGGPKGKPKAAEVLEVLEKPRNSVSVNLLGVPLGRRAAYFLELLPGIQAMRARTGRPHWLVIDEAHELLRSTLRPEVLAIPKDRPSLLLITPYPDQVAPAVLGSLNGLVATGSDPGAVARQFNAGSGGNPRLPEPLGAPLASGQAPASNQVPASDQVMVWLLRDAQAPRRVTLQRPSMEPRRQQSVRRRH